MSFTRDRCWCHRAPASSVHYAKKRAAQGARVTPETLALAKRLDDERAARCNH